MIIRILLLSVLVFCLAINLACAEDSVSVIDSPSSFPASIAVDTYIIQNPGTFMGIPLGSYFSLQSSSDVVSFSDFLKGEVMSEIGTGKDNFGVVQVESLKVHNIGVRPTYYTLLLGLEPIESPNGPTT